MIGEMGLSGLLKLMGLNAFLAAPAMARSEEGATVGREAEGDTPPATSPAEIFIPLAPEARDALREIGLPEDMSPIYAGDLRACDEPKESARRFVVWMRATGQAGAYTADRLLRCYLEFCDVDHRKPVPDNHFLGELKRTDGVRKDRPREGTRRLRWTITPGRLGRIVMHTTTRKR